MKSTHKHAVTALIAALTLLLSTTALADSITLQDMLTDYQRESAGGI